MKAAALATQVGKFARSFHATAPLAIAPYRRPYESLAKDECQWPADNIEAQQMLPGQSMWATGVGRHFKSFERRVNIRRRVPSRFTQMIGGKRTRTFSIHFDRGYVEREPNQGSRMGSEPFVMTRRKMGQFGSIQDAEAFAVNQGYTINRSNPNNMRYNPVVGLNNRHWKQSYFFSKDTYISPHTGKGSPPAKDPQSGGNRLALQSPTKAKVSKRTVSEE
eukprot:NODE_6775_length_818_cov_117.732374_g6539_i0.p1 GENE.NODE_6775_length_818_cov_117.732374_g6539_i0~~NODE_6775_length_818_cov_117.732374_g6539_i0.p1  ORF type:complete len:220 (+),score=43.51 NODE_6775_length_818_cov_117.732374_g6539_i0:66-725(+)